MLGIVTLTNCNEVEYDKIWSEMAKLKKCMKQIDIPRYPWKLPAIAYCQIGQWLDGMWVLVRNFY